MSAEFSAPYQRPGIQSLETCLSSCVSSTVWERRWTPHVDISDCSEARNSVEKFLRNGPVFKESLENVESPERSKCKKTFPLPQPKGRRDGALSKRQSSQRESGVVRQNSGSKLDFSPPAPCLPSGWHRSSLQ